MGKINIKKLSIILVVMVLPSLVLVGACAADTVDGGIKYEVVNNALTISAASSEEITEIDPATPGVKYLPGKMKDYKFHGGPWGTDITSVSINSGVISVGDYAFAECTDLTLVTFPTDGNFTIGDYAFFGCTDLQSVAIPDNVTEIGAGPFMNCTKLCSISGINNNSYVADDGVLFSKDGTSHNKTGLIQYPNGKEDEEYTIGNPVETIGNSAFAGCTNLKSVIFGDSVTEIGECAFMNCTGLASVSIPDNIASMGKGAFDSCTGLASVTIEGTMGDYAFCNCDHITSVTIGDHVSTISFCAFYKCTGLTTVTIPDSVTTIGVSAFEECNHMISAIIGNNVTSIGLTVFKGCTSLTSVTIPDSVTSIGDFAFFECTSLTSVAIPESVTSIGKSAFFGCSGLTFVAIEGNPLVGGYAFANCSLNPVFYLTTEIGNTADMTYRVYLNGGKLKSGFAQEEKKLPADSKLTKHGYAFGGWYDDAELTTEHTSADVGTTPVYAEWNEVIIPVTEVSLDKSSMTLSHGTTEKLTATVLPEDATDKSVLWYSSNEKVAKVDENGLVKAVSNGTATITVKTNDSGFTATCDVEVYTPSSGSSVTSFSGVKDGNDFTFDRAVVITKATLPGATSARITNTSGSGWYNCNLSTDGTTGVLYFQVPLDVISIKGYTVNDVSMLGCKTTYLKSENGYAKYSAVINGAGSYTIDFEKDVATAAVETPVTTDYTQGYLKITSVPAGATIQIEGVDYIGYTPQEKISLNPGIYTVTLSLDGYEDTVKTVVISDDATSTVTADLKQKSGTTATTTAKTPFPVLGILAGLGAAAFFLRRR